MGFWGLGKRRSGKGAGRRLSYGSPLAWGGGQGGGAGGGAGGGQGGLGGAKKEGAERAGWGRGGGVGGG